MSVCLIGYCNNNPLVQCGFVFYTDIVNNELYLRDTPDANKVIIRSYRDKISLESPTYCMGHGVRFNIKLDNQTGYFTTGLDAYSSGSSGILEPVLIPHLLNFLIEERLIDNEVSKHIKKICSQSACESIA